MRRGPALILAAVAILLVSLAILAVSYVTYPT